MFLKRANYLAEIKILLYISQERLQETGIPSIGFVLWATGFMMSTFRIDWQTDVRLLQFSRIEVRDQ